MFEMKKGLASLAIAGTMLGTTVLGAAAAPPANNGPQTDAANAVVSQLTTLVGQGGLINVNDNTAQVGLVNVSKSLNSLQILNNFLNENDIAINRVVAVSVLSGGDIIVFQR